MNFPLFKFKFHWIVAFSAAQNKQFSQKRGIFSCLNVNILDRKLNLSKINFGFKK